MDTWQRAVPPYASVGASHHVRYWTGLYRIRCARTQLDFVKCIITTDDVKGAPNVNPRTRKRKKVGQKQTRKTP